MTKRPVTNGNDRNQSSLPSELIPFTIVSKLNSNDTILVNSRTLNPRDRQTKGVKATRETEFLHCYDKCKDRLQHCIITQGNLFEGDPIEISTLVITLLLHMKKVLFAILWFALCITDGRIVPIWL